MSILLQAFVEVVSLLLNLYIWIIIIATFMVIVKADESLGIVRAIYALSNYLLSGINSILPYKFTHFRDIDLTPLIAIIFLKFMDLCLMKATYTFIS